MLFGEQQKQAKMTANIITLVAIASLPQNLQAQKPISCLINR
jgi:hypothetical protein